MCNQDHSHDHGRFEAGRFGRFQPIGRRTFLTSVGKGTFALLTEVSLARNVITIALGTTGLVACAAPPATQATSTTAPNVVPTSTGVETATEVPTATTAATEAPAATAMPTALPASIGTGAVIYNRVDLGFVNAYVLVRGNEVAVVDTGVANSQSKIEEVIKAIGKSWGDVKHVILTHYHPDHAGSMDAVMKASTNAAAYAGELDIPQIKTSATIKAIGDGTDVFGLQIITTPGHTAGHISVFDPVGSVFIAGDALNNNGTLSGPNPQFSADMVTGILSAKKIATLTFERAFFGHGTPIDAGASAAIAKLAATLK